MFEELASKLHESMHKKVVSRKLVKESTTNEKQTTYSLEEVEAIVRNKLKPIQDKLDAFDNDEDYGKELENISNQLGIDIDTLDSLVFQSADYLHYNQNLDDNVSEFLAALDNNTNDTKMPESRNRLKEYRDKLKEAKINEEVEIMVYEDHISGSIYKVEDDSDNAVTKLYCEGEVIAEFPETGRGPIIYDEYSVVDGFINMILEFGQTADNVEESKKKDSKKTKCSKKKATK